MKYPFLSLAALTCTQALLPAPLAAREAQPARTPAAGQDSRPNLIVFLVDDMGWQDTSVPFWTEKTPLNALYETPNMERLAAQGMCFTQAYASSVSSPSRVSLITGANAARHRVTNWTLHKDKGTDKAHPTLDLPPWNVNAVDPVGNLPLAFPATSLAQLLKDHGYYTLHCGKAHWGAVGTPGADPRNFGFEVNIAGHAGGGIANYLGTQNFGNKPGGVGQSPFAVPHLEKYHGQDIFVTEALTREVLQALEGALTQERPFFLHMAHYAVHVPIQPDLRFYDKYLAKGMSPTEAAYATLVEGMDKSLGDIMDWLEARGQAENTVILFMSDNGGLAASDRTAPLHVQNAPLRSGKGSAYEGGIRVPLIVKWPGTVAPATRCADYVIVEDFFPTLLEMAGVRKYSTRQRVDGKSMVPLLKQQGGPQKPRPLIWNFPNLWGSAGPGIGSTCTLRLGDWKLVYYYASGKKELFNIREDIGETRDLAAREPARVAQLSKVLGKRLRKMGAQRPSFKESGRPCPWPDEVR